MTKGQLSYTWVPIERYLYKSDLWRDLVTDFGSAGPVAWLVLQGEWREPEAEIIERNGRRGLYRRCRFSYLWGFMPPQVGSKTLAKILLWLDDRKHWTLEAEDRQFLVRLVSDECQSMHRGRTHCRQEVGAFWPKLLKFREGCFGYIDKRDIGAGSIEPNQDESKPSFKYVLNSETGEYDRIPIAEKDLREDIDGT